MNPPHGDLVLSVVAIRSSPNLEIIVIQFTSKLYFEDHVCGVVDPVSQRNGVLKLVNCMFVDISVLLRCYYAFVSLILEKFSPMCRSAAGCHLLLLERLVHSVERPFPDEGSLPLSHHLHVAGLRVYSNSIIITI